ncbi:phage portal protein [Trichlorobacter lovleyi]|uniref:phage portal protein n=1 Tax=Trichlorobacter lovleyi TaxID=313985 RepID=UPI003D0F7A93
MSVLRTIGSGIDRAIGLFQPRNELQRIADRAMVEKARKMESRMYAAAKPNRGTGDWIPVNQDINTLIRSSSNNLRARVRQLVRDCPHFARAVQVQVDFTIGTGTNFQSRIRNPKWKPGEKGQSRFDRKLCQTVEDAVNWWMDEADASGRMHFGELERLAKSQDVEVGEFLFVKTFIKDPKRFIPFALMPYEVDWLTTNYQGVAAGNEADQGKEFDPVTGRIVAYHLQPPSTFGIYGLKSASKAVRIPAEFVLNHFETRRPGQLSGVSPFVTAVLIARDLDDYLGATVDTAKLAAKYLALIETPDASIFQNGRVTTDDTNKKVEDLENAIIEYLRPGDKVNLLKSDPASDTFDPFTRFILRVVAIATNSSYTLLSGDYSQGSYTTMRMERQDLIKMFAYPQFRHVKHFSAPAVEEAIYWSVIAGKLKLPSDFMINPRPYYRGVYIPPGMEPIDPLRESKANNDEMTAGTRSPQEIAAKRGKDLEDIYDEIAEAQEMAQERGLSFGEVSTALANNPAALGATDNKRALRSMIQEELLLMEDIDK